MHNFFNIILCNDWIYFQQYLINRYSGYNIINCSSLDYALFKIKQKSFLTTNNRIFVIDNEQDLANNIDTVDALISNTRKNNDLIIYKLDNIDKRSKIYKKYSRYIKNLDLSEGYTFIKKYFDIDLDTYNHIISNCNNNFSRAYFEIDKANNLSCVRNISIKQAFDAISEITNFQSLTTAFTLTNLFISKDIKQLKEQLKLINTNEFDFGLLALLYSQYHNLFVVKSAGKNANTQSTGLTQFTIFECKKYINLYSIDELKLILNQLFDLDYKIKSGMLSSEYAYDLMLTRLLF